MTGIDADVLEYHQALAAYEKAVEELGTATRELEAIRIQWEPLMGTSEGTELALAFGQASRQAEKASERLTVAREHWEAIQARVDVVRAIEGVKNAAAAGHA